MPDLRAEAELLRLRSECCACEKCGHVQAEPNWCHKCGHRVEFPVWAKSLLAELQDAKAREDEWRDKYELLNARLGSLLIRDPAESE